MAHSTRDKAANASAESHGNSPSSTSGHPTGTPENTPENTRGNAEGDSTQTTSARAKVLIASDHAAVDLKRHLIEQIKDVEWEDLGPTNGDPVDYPDYADKLASRISNQEDERGILICGSGIGMCIAANKFPNVRGANVETTTGARLSREHNNANVLCLGARVLTQELATDIVRIWLTTPFSGDPRHQRRIGKITKIETRNHKRK